jgi:Rps23 Pro-64 3,4-dihydroxylase Tpa1-like proline 4-hydroxylase
VLALIQPGLVERFAGLRGRFVCAQPFRHVVIDDFLAPEFCRQLLSEFPPFDERRALNERGEVGGKAVHHNLAQLGPAYTRLDRMLRSREFLNFIGGITDIPDLLYDPEYVGGGTHENRDGQDLDPHVDFNYHPKSQLHRRLNLIIFLNPDWDPAWGGSLELHLNPWLPGEQNRFETVVPVMNRCVLFETTENSWHGFRKIVFPPDKKHLSRRSIAVYFYTRERPAAEHAPSHGTFYVPWGLPEHIRAGHTLSQEDVASIRLLLDRRDTHLRFLYERELEFMSALSAIIKSRAFQLSRMVLWPLRKIRDLQRRI